jgi:hypothetical protein
MTLNIAREIASLGRVAVKERRVGLSQFTLVPAARPCKAAFEADSLWT